MSFYGTLDAGRSAYVTRHGDDAHGVRVNATLQSEHARGVVEVVMDGRGRWSLLTDDLRGSGYTTLMQGDLATGETWVGKR